MTIGELVQHSHTLSHTLHTSSEGRSSSSGGDVEFDRGGA
jgi:hypothetical protein